MNAKEVVIGNLLVVLVVGYVFYWIWARMEENRFKRWIKEQFESIKGQK